MASLHFSLCFICGIRNGQYVQCKALVFGFSLICNFTVDDLWNDCCQVFDLLLDLVSSSSSTITQPPQRTITPCKGDGKCTIFAGAGGFNWWPTLLSQTVATKQVTVIVGNGTSLTKSTIISDSNPLNIDESLFTTFEGYGAANILTDTSTTVDDFTLVSTTGVRALRSRP